MNTRKKSLISDIQQKIHTVSNDKVTVYAAQASFFMIISAVPFLSLLIAIVSFLLPPDVLSFFENYSLSEKTMDIIGSVVTELQSAPKVSLLSVSILATLWSASKGISAIQMGLETVYHSESGRGFFFRILKSLFNTLAFIALILLSVVLILFGDFLMDLLKLSKITAVILPAILRGHKPYIFLFMCAVFTLLYASAAKQSTSFKTTLLSHLPGAVIASAGWILFSAAYSLYIRYFPRASYIYGGLAAICLILLWLYFCMIILLMGAEINKWILEVRKNRK